MTTRKIIAEEAVYHITQRAPGRELVFVEDNDYRSFLYSLEKTSRKYSLDILCFALLPNHLHLLIKINDENLNKAMKYLFQSYAQRFNKKYKRKGHVFCGVYRASLCCDDAYLIAASLYIHLNAYKANLVKDPFGYKWSSLPFYTNDTNSSFVNTDYVLGVINEGNKLKAMRAYKEMIEGGMKCRLNNI